MWLGQPERSLERLVALTGYLRSIDDESGSERDVLASPRLVSGMHSEAFDGFYTREYSSLVALAHVLMGTGGHAEDIAQEAMLAAYRRWDEVGAMDFPAAWVRRVCANMATSVVRRKIVEARAMVTLRRPHTEVRALDEGASAFWAEVRRLPRRQAQCLALFYIYECSVKETAEVLGCSEGTVKTHLARGRAAMAARLDIHLDEGV